MDRPDADYFLERAEEELKSAQRATHPDVVKVHYTMAGHYLDRVYGPSEDERDGSHAEAGETSGRRNVEA